MLIFPIRLKIWFLCLLGASCLSVGLLAQEAKPSFDDITRLQAAYLRNLGEYTRWPDAVNVQERGVVIGIVGKDARGVGRILDYGAKVMEIKVKGKLPEIMKFPDANAKGVADCDILFVLESERSRVAALLESLGDKPILTISEIPGFASRGGMVEFEKTGRSKIRVTLAINREAAGKTGLTFSSKLLGLKKGVRVLQP